MKLLKFVERNGPRSVVVKDESTLPKVGSGWVAAGTIDVQSGEPPRIGASADEILANIETHGFFMLGAKNA
jgi:hypothetical protein